MLPGALLLAADMLRLPVASAHRLAGFLLQYAVGDG